MLHIWAESSGLPLVISRGRGRPPKRPKPRPHPFALDGDSLREAIGEITGSLIAQSANSGAVTIRLPSSSQGPLPSPELILETVRGDEQATALLPWKLATSTLDPHSALDLLLSLPIRPPHGIALGGSLRFWAEVAKFSLELIVRQCFVPTVQQIQPEGSTSARASWEVALGEEDRERLRLLAAAMPPLCRALVPSEDKPSAPPLSLISHFLNRTVDAFVRERLSATKFRSPRRGRRPKVIPLAEQWLRALSSADATLRAPDKELTAFTKGIDSWLAHIRPAGSEAPFRTCFRVEPPEDGSEWRISFYLQANDDRSLLVPAELVWKARSRVVTFLKRNFENPQERLLADLGRASRLFPDLEESLQASHPTALELGTEQAYAFLRQSAPLLEQSGYGVLLPSWWGQPTTRLGVKLALKPKAKAKAAAKTGSGIMGLDAVLSYDWQIALGERTLSRKEFQQLVQLKIPLVKVRGQWVELRPEEIEKAVEFFQKKRAGQEMQLGEALRIGLGQGESAVGLPVMDIEGQGSFKDLLDKLTGDMKISLIKTPRAFRGKLRPYQRLGVSWLAFLRQFGLGACLADDMGLGKTIELIALLLHERAGKKNKLRPDPTLLICPMSIVGNWHREIQRFAPSLNVMVHHGAERLSGRAFKRAAKQHDVVITTYALIHRDEKHLAAVEWDSVVLDEAQNIKNPAAKQTQAIRRLSAQHRIALTGTPVENRLSELWSIISFLNPGYLGSAKDFRSSYALPIEKYRDSGRAAALRRLIGPFVLRRLKSDKSIIKDLPEKLEMKVLCNLVQEQASLYEAVVKEMLAVIESSEGIERKGLVLATLMKLKQVCNHPAQFVRDGSPLRGRSGKLARLEEMLEEALAAGDKALIFTQFAEMGGLLRPYLQERLGCEVLYLHGGTPQKQRDGMVQRFQEEHRGPPLFILSLKAGGVGLNLTAANHVFHFDRWWNPAVENQATDRAFRIGQRKNVQVYKFVCVGTLEERIDQMIESKQELAESIVGGGENWITEMSTGQLKELFALSRDAVSL
ncbi:MAG TPA: DEAD/DEAH box helicase [Candidatus Fraserbacteria bacterium]|nr:DEAD/DEAH box helicase [Candidatus Fraserbacteria bacterium]